MGRFAFMLHAMDVSDVTGKYPVLKSLPDPWVERLLTLAPAVKISEITGVRSPHSETEGWFVGCLLTSKQLLTLPESFSIRKILQAGRLAEKLGAEILGLGAFTSVVGDAGVTVAEKLGIGVTTGNSYTVATAVEGTREAARVMDIDLARAEVAVVGATGSIGRTVSLLMARDVRYLTLVGREKAKLDALAERLLQETGGAPNVSTDLKRTLRQADVVITVSSAGEAIIEPEDLKTGSVVCDVARPRDVSRRVIGTRDDVLVIEGGIVEVPGNVDFGLDFGLPPRMCMACMAETMILALEGRRGDYTLGRDLSLQQVEEISALASKHGFRLAGFRSFEKALSEEYVQAVKENARRRRQPGGTGLRKISPVNGQ